MDNKTTERLFHNHAFSENLRKDVSRFYSITEASRAYFDSVLARNSEGKEVLEFGCGDYWAHAVLMARHGARVTAIDISEVAVEKSRESAIRNRVADGVQFRCMDAENLEYPAASFDVVVGGGILHHLNLRRALSEVTRVLRPDGRAFFMEPLGHNPVINLYRRHTPNLRTPDEHPLLERDLDVCREYFHRLDAHYFHLSSLVSLPLCKSPIFNPAVRALEAVDRALFRLVPAARRYAWVVTLQLDGPMASAEAIRAVS